MTFKSVVFLHILTAITKSLVLADDPRSYSGKGGLNKISHHFVQILNLTRKGKNRVHMYVGGRPRSVRPDQNTLQIAHLAVSTLDAVGATRERRSRLSRLGRTEHISAFRRHAGVVHAGLNLLSNKLTGLLFCPFKQK